MWSDDPQKQSADLSSRFEGKSSGKESNIGSDIEKAVWIFAGVGIKNGRNANQGIKPWKASIKCIKEILSFFKNNLY